MKTSKALPWGIALLALTLCGALYDANQRADGVNRERLRVADSTIQALHASRSRVDTVYTRDTVRLWRTVEHTTTLIDTLMHSDTVTLTQRESVLVFVADSLVTQCTQTVLDCEQRVAVRDSLVRMTGLERDLWKQRASPSLVSKLMTGAKWIGFYLLVKEAVR